YGPRHDRPALRATTVRRGPVRDHRRAHRRAHRVRRHRAGRRRARHPGPALGGSCPAGVRRRDRHVPQRAPAARHAPRQLPPAPRRAHGRRRGGGRSGAFRGRRGGRVVSALRPAPTVVVRGGTEPTAIETAAVVAQAVALTVRADLVGASLAALRRARESVSAAAASPTTWGGRLGAPSTTLAAAGGWSTDAVRVWPAEVRAARAAALEAFDLAIGVAQEQERELRRLGSRLHQAVRGYDDADATATALWQDAGLLALGGFSPIAT